MVQWLGFHALTVAAGVRFPVGEFLFCPSGIALLFAHTCCMPRRCFCCCRLLVCALAGHGPCRVVADEPIP
ncbi:hypothetical protein BC831DRAFT_170105 [Entophlyctis helioformis]|nr:hypothetical protein BC831DRAFT_170105 [Entophlyctis helioformis]